MAKTTETTTHVQFHKSVMNVITTRVPVITPDTTIGEIKKLITKNNSEYKSIDYLYIVDKRGCLVGTCSIKELFRQNINVAVGSIATKELITAHPVATQEKAALLALRHNLKAIPVVDSEGVFLGIIPNNVILSILEREAREDALHLAGIRRAHAGFDDILKLPLLKALEHRLPWLFLGLLGGILAANIIGRFERTLSENIILAAFIPLIVYMADSVRIQIEAFVIRDFAVASTVSHGRYFLKQFQIVAAISIILGAILALWGMIQYQSVHIGLVLSISLMLASLVSLITGLLIPIIFSKLKSDPANASGPIGTIIQDMLSVTIYFTVASLLL